MIDTDRSHLLMFLAATRMVHAVLAEERGDELVIYERLDRKTPPMVKDDSAYFGLDYSDSTGSTGNEAAVIEHMLDKKMLELKYDEYRGYYKVTEFGRGFALGAARNVILTRGD